MSGQGSREGAARFVDASQVVSRRRFLAGLGMLAGGGALAPLLSSRLGRGPRERLEASRPMLGTWMRVVVRHDDRGASERAVRDAFAAVRTVDAQMSVHRGDS